MDKRNQNLYINEENFEKNKYNIYKYIKEVNALISDFPEVKKPLSKIILDEKIKIAKSIMCEDDETQV